MMMHVTDNPCLPEDSLQKITGEPVRTRVQDASV